MTQPPLALATGELHVLGRLAEASNLALLAEVSTDTGPMRCIYKPVSGERPLWDFPGAALAAREVLTAEVAACFGWDVIPPTSWREEGPFGAGMCQAWVEALDDDPVGLFASGQVPEGWREVAEGRDGGGAPIVLAHESSRTLQRLVVLDALVNNADRKGGHLLRRTDGTVTGIDHGVTFHAENKLRTVLWGWAGEPIPAELLAEVTDGSVAFGRLVQEWGNDTPHRAAHLSAAEVRAAQDRLESLLGQGTFPMPGAQWPSLPWPPM